jgi:5-methylcytosine-specific restriction enzyme B
MFLIEEGHQEQNDFLATWPIERLERMTLEEYTNLDTDTAFVYWLEKKTEHSGSVWGGSAYKFGIFRRRNIDTQKIKDNAKTDGVYSWYAKYGNNKEEAFQNVKSIVLKIAKASQGARYGEIDELDLGEAIKWKIAFHYNVSGLIPIFKKEVLFRVAESNGVEDVKLKSISELQQIAIGLKPETDSTLEFSERLWKQFNLDNFYYVVDKFLVQAQTDNLKKRGFPRNYRGLDVKVSFGTGGVAKIPWIAFLKEPNKVTEGSYPVYLYYKEVNTLVLAYGVSETTEIKHNWDFSEEQLSIKDWYVKTFAKEPYRYGSSFYKSSYNLDEELDAEQIQTDLTDIIKEYSSLEFPNSALGIEKPEEGRSKKYWIIAPGEEARKWGEYYKEGIIGVGWDELGDLSKYDDREDITAALLNLYPGVSKSQRNNSLALWQFLNEMMPGDILITKKGINEYLGYGVVTSEYYFDNSKTEYKHLHKVDWKKKGSWPEEVHQIVLKTLTDITKYTEYVDRLKRLIGIDQEAVIPMSVNYWWLNANPKYWKIEDFEIGQEQSYTTYNEKGNKRSRFEYFQAAKPGDLIIGYESSPTKKVVAVFEVTRGVHIDEDDGEEKVSFTILKFLPDQITWDELKKMPELENCEVLRNNQGSLFKLEKNEYDAIVNRDVNSQYEEYALSDALRELFISETELDNIIKSLNYKKNIILQGPPGTGKTFMAKRLAHLLLEEKDQTKIEMVQFHQSYSYEDFIQGYRPTDDGKFKLENGVFYRFCKKAQSDLDKKYIFIIDEINRGNLSKIFGELMLLIESDKRGNDYGVSLTYFHSNDSKFYIPDNVYIIGTMNTADRSLAMVDYALRRRFVFINVMPNFNQNFENELINNGVDEGIVERIVSRIESLNQQIKEDANLGKGFQIGHSYFCNFHNSSGDEDWYKFIVQHEIGPLLEEYWFDNEDKAQVQIQRLIG